ncbi:MAG: hypothetical protein PCFJNLEI_00031 [Verrucomicrobiae bacterium]|nr:hypothetical protein [Verrucomicrobiae bacterium]
MAKRILIWLVVVATGWTAEVVPVMDVNGTRYRDVKFGPVNQDQIVLFHSKGVATVPVSSLPETYREQFAPKPAPGGAPVPAVVEPLRIRTPVSQPTNNPGAILEAMRSKKSEPIMTGGSRNDWTLYNQQRASLVVLDGMLVEKSSLTPLVGFLAKERASLSDGTRTYYGAAFDLAERKNGNDNVAAVMELRPALWNRTDERVFLVNYKPMTLPGALMKVYAVEIDPIDQWRTFKVGTDPSFEDWKRLPRK